MYEIKKRKLKKHSCKMKDIYSLQREARFIYYIFIIILYIQYKKKVVIRNVNRKMLDRHF